MVVFYFYIYPEVRFLVVVQVCRHRGGSGMSQGGTARVNQLPVCLGPDILPGLAAAGGSSRFYLIKTNMQEGSFSPLSFITFSLS